MSEFLFRLSEWFDRQSALVHGLMIAGLLLVYGLVVWFWTR